MSQIRSFLAIDLDDDFKPKVNKIIKEFKKIDANIKFVDLNNLHFTTHLTIGRMKSAKGKNQVRDVIEEFENVEIGEMNISNIAFKKSTLKPSGPIYENLKTYDL